jgi:hypothetical protein
VCCVLCAVCCVLCAVCAVCAVCCVLCAVCAVCCVCCVLCAVCCVLCAVCCVLCAVCCVLCVLCGGSCACAPLRAEPASTTRYPEHRALDLLLAQERAGLVHRAKLDVSKVLATEATVTLQLSRAGARSGGSDADSGPSMTTVVVSGRPLLNRAMHGDLVAVEVRPHCCTARGPMPPPHPLAHAHCLKRVPAFMSCPSPSQLLPESQWRSLRSATMLVQSSDDANADGDDDDAAALDSLRGAEVAGAGTMPTGAFHAPLTTRAPCTAPAFVLRTTLCLARDLGLQLRTTTAPASAVAGALLWTFSGGAAFLSPWQPVWLAFSSATFATWWPPSWPKRAGLRTARMRCLRSPWTLGAMVKGVVGGGCGRWGVGWGREARSLSCLREGGVNVCTCSHTIRATPRHASR